MTYYHVTSDLHSYYVTSSLGITSIIRCVLRIQSKLILYREHLDSPQMFVTSEQCGLCRLGTSVAVSNLYKSVPVRRQYYSAVKRKREELKSITDLVMSYSILYYHCRFILKHNKVITCKYMWWTYRLDISLKSTAGVNIDAYHSFFAEFWASDWFCKCSAVDCQQTIKMFFRILSFKKKKPIASDINLEFWNYGLLQAFLELYAHSSLKYSIYFI